MIGVLKGLAKGLTGAYSKYKVVGLLLVACTSISYYTASVRATADCEIKQATKVVVQEKKHDKAKQEITGLSDRDLVKRYCRWVYDTPYDECVQSVVPLR